jgi:membrane fusion protein, copper/silver efflux system
MRTLAKPLAGLLLATGIFLAGYAANRQPAPAAPSDSASQAPSYSCPMHPEYKSDHPADCGICGMRLEPMTSRESGMSGATDTPGMVVVGTGGQQLIGVRTEEVRRDASSQVLRVPGQIAVDDQRLYRVIAATDGWIVNLRENTVGRFVKKNQLLASYYARELLYTERLFLLSIPAGGTAPTTTRDFSQASVRTAGSANPEFPIDALRALGMSDLQIDEIQRTRTASPHVNIYSPASGFVLTRNVSPGQRFDKGTELYRVADISRVWVMTDIFEKDRQFLKPGAKATVLYQGRRFQARMSDALPQFDAQSRTLKTRFELDNPGHVLQPDMFVDVELAVEMPPAITVPADAVFDSGLRKTVFVEHGNGNFEARRVEIGWRMGDRVEIVKGLMESERIVGAANFLLDSESRMKAASAGIFNPETDPVCGMEVDQKRAVAAGRKTEYKGTTYYFCADGCKKRFEADPAKYLSPSHGTPPAPVPPAPITTQVAGTTKPAVLRVSQTPAPAADPVCGMDVEVKAAAAAGRKSDHEGRTYYFCADECKQRFDANPPAFLARKASHD